MPNQEFSLIDGQGRDLGKVQINRIQGDLVLGRFTPGPAYGQVQSLFAEYVAAANEQLLGMVGEVDEKIGRLNLQLYSAERRAFAGMKDVQIGNGTITFHASETGNLTSGPPAVEADLPG
jgi:hypothetical protein